MEVVLLFPFILRIALLVLLLLILLILPSLLEELVSTRCLLGGRGIVTASLLKLDLHGGGLLDFIGDFVKFIQIRMGVKFDEVSEGEFQVEGADVFDEEAGIIIAEAECEGEELQRLLVQVDHEQRSCTQLRRSPLLEEDRAIHLRVHREILEEQPIRRSHEVHHILEETADE